VNQGLPKYKYKNKLLVSVQCVFALRIIMHRKVFYSLNILIAFDLCILCTECMKSVCTGLAVPVSPSVCPHDST
jgi:hypothetical protein